MPDNKKSAVRYFIWDFDGTLMDTFPLMLEKFCRMLADFGICEQQERIAPLLHQAVYRTCGIIGAEHGIDGAELLQAFKRSDDESTGIQPQLFPDIPEILSVIRDHGGHHYLYTHRDDTAWRYLEHAGMRDFFADGVTDSDGFPYTPIPSGLIELLHRNSLPEEECLLIGDSPRDAASAREAGIRSLLIAYDDEPETDSCCPRKELFRRLLKEIDTQQTRA